MRILAIVLTGLWAVTALAVAAAYRPGGPLDLVVAAICFGPVVVAGVGIVWPPEADRSRHRVALAWLWIFAVLFAIPVLYGVASTVFASGPRSLVPSLEAAYAGLLAVLTMAAFSVLGFVHQRRRVSVFEQRATLLSVALAVMVSALIGAAFTLVALINDDALRASLPPRSAYGPTDPDLVPPFCDDPVALGRYASISVVATSSLDDEVRGQAQVSGRRSGIDETWTGAWDGPDGTGRLAYLRLGALAWLSETANDRGVPGRGWRETSPDPFGMGDRDRLTLDGPPHAWVDVPRGAIVAEDLGLEVLDGARARHCRTFMDGPTALARFLPLRWLLRDDWSQSEDDVARWRGEMDWWVFGDGELGRAVVEVSGPRADTSWDATGVRAVLRAELDAVDRDRPADLAVSALDGLAEVRGEPGSVPSTAAPSTGAAAPTAAAAAPSAGAAPSSGAVPSAGAAGVAPSADPDAALQSAAP
jgi:hypothetical protein